MPLIDVLGQASLFGMILLPILITILVFKYSKEKLLSKIVISVVLSLIASITCLAIAMMLILRDGMGP